MNSHNNKKFMNKIQQSELLCPDCINFAGSIYQSLARTKYWNAYSSSSSARISSSRGEEICTTFFFTQGFFWLYTISKWVHWKGKTLLYKIIYQRINILVNDHTIGSKWSSTNYFKHGFSLEETFSKFAIQINFHCTLQH